MKTAELEIHHAVPFDQGSLRVCDGSRNGRAVRRRKLSIYERAAKKK